MKYLQRLIYLLLILFLIVHSSCDSKRLYDKSKKVNNDEWHIGEILKYDVNIHDTLSYYNFYINIRNKGTYEYSNLYLFINIIYPDRKVSRDTIECLLADDKGKWYGKGLGDIKDNRILIKKGLRFQKPGIYSFELEHGMYDTTLVGISDIGIRIEKL